jgi:hypothetical protein
MKKGLNGLRFRGRLLLGRWLSTNILLGATEEAHGERQEQGDAAHHGVVPQ